MQKLLGPFYGTSDVFLYAVFSCLFLCVFPVCIHSVLYYVCVLFSTYS